jgi:tRNA G18 (ribose-2'-O)-methylase SpoU
MKRDKTRAQRVHEKKGGVTLPFSFALVNFMFDENAAFVARTAACFGFSNIYIIGSMPQYSIMRSKSGGSQSLINFAQFNSPSAFLDFARKNNLNLISAELCDGAHNIYDYKFSFQKNNVIVLGHETLGVPVEILAHSDSIYIPMIGRGFCLNTSQAGTAMATEISRQFLCQNKVIRRDVDVPSHSM